VCVCVCVCLCVCVCVCVCVCARARALSVPGGEVSRNLTLKYKGFCGKTGGLGRLMGERESLCATTV